MTAARKRVLGRVLMATCLMSGVVLPTGASADELPKSVSTGAGAGAEIIVTARKREENVQDVSESITVVSGARLDELQIVDQRDLTRISPALTFRANPIPTSSAFAVRGIGTSTFSSTVEQSVSTVVDGVVLGQPQSAAALIDINRVEVLEGPQGLLFGKNASAGLVNIVTNDPRLGALTAEASFTAGTDGELRNTAIVNLPLGNALALRLVGFRNITDGYIENVFRNERYNGERNYGGRAKLLFEPADGFRLVVSGDYAKDTSACCFSTVRTLGNTANLRNAFTQYGIVAGPENREVVPGSPFGSLPGAPLRVYKGVSAQTEIDLGGPSLTSVTGWRSNHYILDFDGDQTPLPRFDYNGGDYRYKQFSQELRLDSDVGGTIEWLVGLFYFRSTNDVFYQAGGGLLTPSGAGPLAVGIIETAVLSKSYAGFGSVTLNASDALRFRAGGRLTRDEIRARRLAYDRPGAFPGSSAIIGSVAGDTTERGKVTNFSWKLTAEYDVAPDVMVYANAASGYKGPGLASSGVVQAGVDPLIRPETVMAYDIGIKSTFLDGAVVLNATAFYEDFDDFQTQIFDTSTTPPGFRTTNAGGLVTKGVEAQLTVRPATGLSLSANGAYIDARYRDLDGLSCPYAYTVPTVSNGCRLVGTRPVINADGFRLANAPKFAFNLAGNYTVPVGGDANMSFALDYAWRSDEQFSANGDPQTIQPAYGILNGSVALAQSEGMWELRAYVRNIFDTYYVDLLAPNAADTTGGYTQFFSRYQDRQAGLTLRVRLGR